MAATLQTRLCGFGGQGIILAGTVLGHAATRDGKWVAGSSSYGAAARGGTCRADVVISDESVVYPLVIEPDILVAMSQSAYDEYIGGVIADEYIEGMTADAVGDAKRRGGLVFYDDRLISPKPVEGVEQIGVPATAAAIEKLDNKQLATMILLAAMVERTGVVSRDALVAAIETVVEPRFRALNLQAIDVAARERET